MNDCRTRSLRATRSRSSRPVINAASGTMERIRVARTVTQADEWALVLTAAGIPHAVAVDDSSWTVLVAADDAARADAALAAYDEESHETTPAPAEPRPYPWMSGVTL